MTVNFVTKWLMIFQVCKTAVWWSFLNCRCCNSRIRTVSSICYCFSVSISSSNSRMFVSGSCDTTARLWDTRVASRAVRTFNGHEGDVNTVKFFPDGNRFGTGSDDGTCRLFDIRTGHELQVYYQQHGENEIPHVTSIAFSKSGRLLFAGYSNGDCYVWDTLLAEVYALAGSVLPKPNHFGTD